MITLDQPLQRLSHHDLVSMKVAKNGEWLVFVTNSGEELRYCCYSMVPVSVDDYWNNYAAAASQSYRLEKTD